MPGSNHKHLNEAVSRGTTLCQSIVFLLLYCGVSYATDEHYTITGSEYLSALKRNNFKIELVQIIDRQYEKLIPQDSRGYLCRLNKKAELVLTTSIKGYDSIACRLTVFDVSDTLVEGWRLNQMHWRGSYPSAEFSVDPRNSLKPHFVVELKHNSSEKNALKELKIRLFVVKLEGPSGKLWRQALIRNHEG